MEGLKRIAFNISIKEFSLLPDNEFTSKSVQIDCILTATDGVHEEREPGIFFIGLIDYYNMMEIMNRLASKLAGRAP